MITRFSTIDLMTGRIFCTWAALATSATVISSRWVSASAMRNSKGLSTVTSPLKSGCSLILVSDASFRAEGSAAAITSPSVQR